MLVAKDKDSGTNYYSWDKKDYIFIKKNKTKFICPDCKTQLIFVDGIDVIKHFRHKTKKQGKCCDFEPESKDRGAIGL